MIKSIKLEEQTITKKDLLELLRLYGLDKEKIEVAIRRAKVEQTFEVETTAGIIKIKLDFGLDAMYLDAPLKVQQMFITNNRKG